VKVCHLTSVHKYNDTRIFVKECCTLANSGFEVYLIAPDAPTGIEQGVHIVGIESENGSRLLRMIKTVKKVYQKALEVDADIYHFHDPELIKVGLKLKRKGKKVIYDVHEDVPRQILSKNWIPKRIRPSISRLFEYYEDKNAKKFDVIITATPYIKERFIKINKNSVVINNFPSLKEMNFKHSPHVEKDNICYVGGITTVRGIFEMVGMLPLVNKKLETKLKLAGPIDGKIKDELLTLKNWEYVDYKGFLNREEIKELLNSSKLGLVTLHPIINYIDALPVKMFEYMAAGIPVIASDFPLWRSIITEANCGVLVDPLDKKAIAQAVIHILLDEERAKEMGENGRKFVEQKYNWEIESVKLVEVYKEF